MTKKMFIRHQTLILVRWYALSGDETRPRHALWKCDF